MKCVFVPSGADGDWLWRGPGHFVFDISQLERVFLPVGHVNPSPRPPHAVQTLEVVSVWTHTHTLSSETQQWDALIHKSASVLAEGAQVWLKCSLDSGVWIVFECLEALPVYWCVHQQHMALERSFSAASASRWTSTPCQGPKPYLRSSGTDFLSPRVFSSRVAFEDEGRLTSVHGSYSAKQSFFRLSSFSCKIHGSFTTLIDV